MIIGDGIMLGAGGESASIFVTGVSETNTVTATKGSKTLTGEWITRKNTEIKSLIPKMTSNTTPEGIASSYSVDSGSAAYYAFDAYGDDVGSDYYTRYPYSAGNDYIQYEFASSVKISKVRMNIFNDRAFTYTILISENGQDWTNVCVFSQDSSLTSGITWMEKDLETVVTAKFIRCRIDHWTDKTGNPAVIREMRVYGPVETEVSGFLFSDVDKYGTWTVTATDGVQTATKNILVDSAIEYDVSISYVDKRLQIWLNGSGYTDESLVGNAITNYGTSLVTSGDFPYYNFDGSNHYIQFPSQTISPNDFAISMWGYFDSLYAYERLFDFGVGTASDFWCGHIGSSGVIVFEYQISGTGYRSSSVTFASGAWHHVAIKGDNGITTLYIDGVSVASVSVSSAELSLANCYLGKSNWDDPYLHGRIADFRLYNTAITDEEIIELYQSGAYVPN